MNEMTGQLYFCLEIRKRIQVGLVNSGACFLFRGSPDKEMKKSFSGNINSRSVYHHGHYFFFSAVDNGAG
ncbi:MAG: hypothetical protein HGB36_04140 [Chlorobiaceae bacterium]|nr:hypothetical protein [Chlorobiaceae bacterium]